MVCSRYSAGGKKEDCYSEVQELETVSRTLTFVDIKISNQHPVACFLRALLATVSLFMFVCVCLGMKNANASYISYILNA